MYPGMWCSPGLAVTVAYEATQDEQTAWLERYSDGNIGLPLGPCSGLEMCSVIRE